MSRITRERKSEEIIRTYNAHGSLLALIAMSTITLKIEFGGGLELLFSNQRSNTVTLPSSPAPDVDYLIKWLTDNLLKERVELFVENNTVYVSQYSIVMAGADEEGAIRRPGILVLINDTDWELEDEGKYVLKDGDEIVFISTLHGG